MLLTNKIIFLPKLIQEKYNLPTAIVSIHHIHELVKYQETLEFKLVPKLSQEDLLPSHYDKMKVSKATNIINHDVSSALKFVAESENKPDFLTTAWFVDQLERWFYLMTSRSPVNALSTLNEEAYEKAVTFLNDFMEIITLMEVGIKKIWKPSQTGMLISTKSILDLQNILLKEKEYKFVLTGRFSQDCLENVFSILRSKQITPNAMQVKNHLKILCISQYLKCPKATSYEEDDREFFSEFINVIECCPKQQYDTVKLPDTISECVALNYSELNSLYNIAGYIISSIKKTSKTCDICVNSVGSQQPFEMVFTKFSYIKCFRAKTLFFCHESVFYFFVDMEDVFRKYYAIVRNQNINLKQFFVDHMSKIDVPIISSCHNLKNKVISRFVVFRLKIASKKLNERTNKFSSKSLR